MRSLALAVAFAATAPAAGAAMPDKLQPGIYIEATAGNGCTANFVYDGIDRAYGRVFLGTAAHCVAATGEQITSGGEVIGRVASRGDESGTATDWALIEIPPSLHARVDPELLGHPGIPAGLPLLPGQAERNDSVQFSGYGQGFHLLAQTRESRTGLLQTLDDEVVRIAGPVSTGDSGGPAVHLPSGRPLAIVTAIQASAGNDADGEYASTVTGPTTAQILRLAAAKGIPVRLRTIDSPPLTPPAPPPAPAQSSQPAPAPAPAAQTGPPAGKPAAPAAKKKKKQRATACRTRAKRIRNARKRRAALRRCARARR